MRRLRVDFKNAQREVCVSVSSKSISDVVEVVLLLEHRKADSLSVSFVSDRVMRKYHKQFFGDASSTDCISLPLDADFEQNVPFRHLGEIFICPKTALLYVEKNTTLFWKELTLYLVHSLLHLLGYDDITKIQRSKMRQREQKALAFLTKKGLLLSGCFR